MYFVVMPNGSHSEHLGMYCIVMPSVFVNCPAVICLPNIASYLRDTTSDLWTPVLSFTYCLQHLLQSSVYSSLQLLLFSNTVLLTLCSARPEGLTTSLFRVGQSSGLFMCRFHVVEGTTVNQATALLWRLGRSHQQQPSVDHQVLLVR